MKKGFTKIDNDLLEAILGGNFSLREIKVIFTVIRYTSGFQRNEAKLSLRFIARTTKIFYNNISDIIVKLVNKNILSINQNDNIRGRSIVFNGDYKTWKIDNLPCADSYQNNNSYQNDNHKVIETITDMVIEPITKKEIYKENINKVLSHWNSKRIIIHKNITDTMERKINSALNNYTPEEINNAIDNYSLILEGDEYYFKYKWTLADFLQRGLEKFMDKETAEQNYKKHDDSAPNLFRLNPRLTFNLRGHKDEQE